jgi:hypothetical protein
MADPHPIITPGYSQFAPMPSDIKALAASIAAPLVDYQAS